MHHDRFLRLGAAAFVLAIGALASRGVAAEDVNMWDGQWHYEAIIYGWVPWLYSTVNLPPIAGGGSQTIETEPHQYLKYVEMGALVEATVRKGDWSLWTDLVYLNLATTPTHVREIGLPGGDATLSVIRTIDSGIRASILTLAPGYTVMNNDVGTVDVMVGMRYTSVSLSLSYEFTAPPTPLMKGGGFWPSADSTDALVGVKGHLRLSQDGKWFLPFEADVADGNKNWQNNEYVGIAYHFHWGDLGLGCRNLTYQLSDRPIMQKVRMTGPTFGAAFRW